MELYKNSFYFFFRKNFFILFLVFFFASSSDYYSVYAAEKNGTFLLSLPAELHGGTTEKFCITFFDLRIDVNIIFVIHNEDNTWNFNKRDLYAKGECRCTEIEVPEVYMEGFYILTIWGFEEDQSLLFSKTIDKVKIVNNNTLTFLQTDKYFYVPGQKVKFRILTTNINLKPKAGLISEVCVINPFGIKMKKWLDVTKIQGLMSFSFDIAPQPVLGKWVLRVTDGNKITETDFEVQKYVLPRFEVRIESPSYLLLNSPEIKIKVCAIQAQGKEIRGRLKSQICIYTPSAENDGRPCANYTAEICGCHNFTVNSSSIGLSLQKYSLKNAVLEVLASVTDFDSRITVNSTILGPEIKNQHVTIDLQSSEIFFKPGFLYNGKANIYKPDNTIAPNEIVEISAIDYVNDIRLSKNFTSDKNGVITFTINQFDSRTEQFYLEARSINGTISSEDDHHLMYTPIDQKQIKQWYSPGKKYLKILPIKDVQSCRKNLNIKLLYNGKQREKITIYYLVMSKSQIVSNGQMSYRVDHRHAYKMETPNNLLETLVNNLAEVEEAKSGEEHFANKVFTSTSHPEIDSVFGANITGDAKPEALETNVVVEEEEEEKEEKEEEKGEKKKKKKRKKKKNKQRKSRSTKEYFIAELNLNLQITPEMSPLSYLTVYFLNDDGELLSDYQEFEVRTCFKNQIGFKIPETPLYPGEVIDFQLTGSNNSYCALNLVDMSTFPGYSSWITKEQVFNKLKKYHYVYGNQILQADEYCQNVLLEQQHGIVSSDYRSKRSTSVYSSKYVDAIYAFQASGLVLLTDLSLESRPCSWIDPPTSYDTSKATEELWEEFHKMADPREDNLQIEDTFLPEERYGILDYFQEPWLWTEAKIKKNQSVVVHSKVPYAANDWTGNIFCASETDGLGLLSLPIISTFQPFSISYIVPYTCVAGERIPLSITIQSNVKSCLSIQLFIEKSILSQNKSEKLEGPDMCVCNEEFITNKSYLDNLMPGSINLTVFAVVVETQNGKCTSETMEQEYLGKTDFSNAIIEIFAPGFRHEFVHSDYICPRENDGGLYIYSITSKIPPNVISGSVKATVFMFGNMVWPGINQLDDWTRDPITNGEGNILNIAAIICVMDYLNAVGLVSYEIESKIMKMIEKGYQQQMNYLHDDSSYSIFGIKDEGGSEILTAFVIQILVKARSYVYIDDHNLQKSIAWLRSRQQDDGCFFDQGDQAKMAKYKMEPQKLKAIHTAKIIISLLQFGTPQYDPIIEKGFSCLQSVEPEDLYLLSLYTFAYSIYGLDEQQTDKYQRELETKSISSENIKYWKVSDEGEKVSVVTSLDIETTSYALLGLLGNEADSSWQDLKPIVHWLIKQRKPMGGFISSRDSLIAFQAITNYALMWSQRQEVPELKIKVLDGLDTKQLFEIHEDNLFDLLLYESNSFENKIRVEAEGYGCGIVQTSLTYNMPSLNQAQSFHIHIGSHRDHNNCAERKLRICCRYTGNNERTNVVIMKIKMVTGWIPQQILEIKNFKNIGVKKHEMTEDYVYFYFNEMTKSDKCVIIQLEQVLRITTLPATVFVYDYYNKHQVGYSQYNLKTTCGTKEELPDATIEEYLTSMSQVRKPVALPDDLKALFNKTKKKVKSTTQLPIQVTPTVAIENLKNLSTQAPLSELDLAATNRTIKDAEKVTVPPNSTQMECPKCLAKAPEKYEELFCRATQVYKVATGKEKDLMKIIADLRPPKKLVIDKQIIPVLKDSCKCQTLKGKGRYLLLRLEPFPAFDNLEKMVFDHQTIFFPLTTKVEKKMRQLAKTCTK